MYLAFYGLEKEPFHITPDPEFFYLSPGHKEAFAAVVCGVERRKGFIALTGEVGTGKTTVLRAYLRQVERSQVRPIYLFDPALSFDELLALLLRELDVTPAETTRAAMTQCLQEKLIQEFESGRNVVLIVDEAQNMPVETLEKLRVLTNLETTEDKLLQIVLVGQPELEQKLEQHTLRQLRQRIAVRATLYPLTEKESYAYLQHRLAQAGSHHVDIFATKALKHIVRAAKGNPRMLNIICDNALVSGFGIQRRPVTLPIVREILKELGAQPIRSRLRPVILAATLCLLSAGCIIGLWQWRTPKPTVQSDGNPLVTQNPAIHSELPSSNKALTPVPAVQPTAGPMASPQSAPSIPATSSPSAVETVAETPALVPKAATTPPPIAPAPAPVAKAIVPPQIPAQVPTAPSAPTASAALSPVSTAQPAVQQQQFIPHPATSPTPRVTSLATTPPAAAPGQGMHPTAPTPPAPAPTPQPPALQATTAAPQPPAPVSVPASPSVASRPDDAEQPKTFPVRVQMGDCLTQLAMEHYGSSRKLYLDLIRHYNKHIPDTYAITAADTLQFPIINGHLLADLERGSDTGTLEEQSSGNITGVHVPSRP